MKNKGIFPPPGSVKGNEKEKIAQKIHQQIPPRGLSLWFVYTPTYIHQDFLKIILKKQRP
jgi:hypothetical protein